MSKLSRRQLAIYAATQLLNGQPMKAVAQDLSAALVESGKQNEMELLISDVAWELENRGIVAQATITTATPISESLRHHLDKFIKQAAGVDNVVTKEQIDRSVLGGVRIETTSHLWDKTISRKLADIREVF
ncbi:F0F1 ATP synthase subunit delta [Candidatus Saccharibacteria bacterium]|nr:F0F1 ATP synthase subunit delta [Candidatus Saccharibacteria bacterium]